VPACDPARDPIGDSRQDSANLLLALHPRHPKTPRLAAVERVLDSAE
jgi:hypothetical protein